MNLNDLEKDGFEGFKTIESLWEDSRCIPKEKGVYMILRLADTPCEYLETGTGGFFKMKNPNIAIRELEAKWVRTTNVVYIGKAGSLTNKATLHSRLNQYLKFGQGMNIGHWGGRLIWQLKDASRLVVCWKTIASQDPRSIEKDLIHRFVIDHGRRPFANLAD